MQSILTGQCHSIWVNISPTLPHLTQGTDPGWLLTCDGLSLTVTMTPDTGHWVSQHSHNITTGGKLQCNAQRSRDPIWPLSANNLLHNNSICAKTNLIFLQELHWYWSANIGIVSFILYHITYHTFQYFTRHHWRTSWKTRMRLINVILMIVTMSSRWLGSSSTTEMRFPPYHYFDERMSLLWQFPTSRAVLQSQ